MSDEMVYRSIGTSHSNKKVHKIEDCFHLRDCEVSHHPLDSMPEWVERCEDCWESDECEKCGSDDTRTIHPFLTYCRACEQTFNPNSQWTKKDTEPFANE